MIYKIMVFLKTICNPWVLLWDKFGLNKNNIYKTFNNQKILCRSNTTDINEAVVVLSGIEYPIQYLNISEGGVVFDLGANIGSFVLWCDLINKGIKYHGFAFEPFEENFKLLNKNIALNKITNFQSFQYAISDLDGLVNLDIDLPVDGIRIADKKNGNTQSYKISTIANILGIVKIDLLKMDIEGSEYDVLISSRDRVTTNVDRIIMEYHNLDYKYNGDFIKDLLGDSFDIIELHSNENNGVLFLKRRIGIFDITTHH